MALRLFRGFVSVNRIYVKCPTSGKLVFTGFAMDPKLFDAFPEQTAPFTCPSCGKEHSWKKADAIFDPNPQPS
jgi:endogenous inhibitor of DNA gyrase (YacG/DUF329 family)